MTEINFGEEIEELIKNVDASFSSAFMSEDFVEKVDQLFDEIPNLRDAFKAMESHADPSNST